MSTSVKLAEEQNEPWSEERLVRECRKGSEEAWSALIDRYKNLIFSIPIKYGFSREDATEIFQSVCFEALQHLAELREPKALTAWIIRITTNKCHQWRRQQDRFIPTADESLESPSASPDGSAEILLQEAQQEQELRDAIGSLSPRCRKLVTLLFYETPSRPYSEVAAELGIAVGSIGFIRGRCLEKLRAALAKAGIK
jgi:RNA polymerase sigma factor (sigma-70 family)